MRIAGGIAIALCAGAGVRIASGIAIALCVGACGSRVPAAPRDAGVPDAGVPDAGVDLAGPCAPGAPRPPVDEWRTLRFQDLTRAYKLHVPPGYTGAPIPLVLNFHGYGSNASQQETLSQMTPKADAENFAVVYPEGTGVPRGWNAGACCGSTSAVDDVGFAAALIEEVAGLVCLDRRRIYATGMSNGGFLSHRLACELAERIAAIAPVAGVIGVPTCAPARPVPVLHFHGTSDRIVPYEGSASLGFPSVRDTIAGWVDRDGCTDGPIESYARGDSRCETWAPCADGARVILCTVDGGGHTWPGGTPVPFLGKTTTDLSATDAMWEFFRAHPRP